MSRRAALLLTLVALLLAACRHAVRCATCGMKIDPGSPWVSYVTLGDQELAFDTPHCALTAWHGAQDRFKGARFREYYSQDLKNVDELRFVVGSDVTGPMGPDVVPVAAGQASRFARDHNGAPPKSAADLLREGVP